ncbi:MAG: hypothetical protein K0S07_73 [Chlamydiales bacterium]|jgi:hypothetical protein|nr:hypothetical protein [Chlamydiales bacterium]
MRIEDFINSLSQYTYQVAGPTSFGQSGLYAEGSSSQFASFLSTFNRSQNWSSWTDFIEKWRAFSGYQTAHPTVGVEEGPAFLGFVSDFKVALGITAAGGDFLHYKNSFASSADFDAEINHIVNGLMTQILNDYPFAADGSAATPTAFFNYLKQAMTVTGYLLTATVGSSQVASYERIYNSLFSSGFSAKLVDFISRKVASAGFFTPSLFYEEWVEEVQADFKATQGTLLSPNEKQRRQIAMTVYDMLIEMMQNLQETVSMQSKATIYLSQWQKEYTTCMQGTPIYVSAPSNYAGLTLDSLHTIAANAMKYEDLDPYHFRIKYWTLVGPSAIAEGTGHHPAGWLGVWTSEYKWAGIWLDYAANPYFQASLHPAPDGSASGSGTTPGPNSFGLGWIKGKYYSWYDGVQLWSTDMVIRQRWQGAGDNADARSARNQVLNQFLEDMRGKRSVIKDQEDQLTNALQNTNHSINQMGDLMTAIMQQMSTMLQSIFR